MMSTAQIGVSNGARVVMAAKKGTKKVAAKKPAAKPSGSKTTAKKKVPGTNLYMPGVTRPEWLDGTLPGDRGFDPLGLSRPVEYLQFDVDNLEQNNAVNRKGNVVGAFNVTTDKVSTETLQPYSEVFGLQRFRECELIHGRWCMLATAGCIVQELVTGIPW